MKAYVVTADWCESSYIVFAETASKAKSAAHGTDGLSDIEWVELACHRVPSIDDQAEKFGPGVIYGNNCDEQKLMRDLGWFQIDGGGMCDACGLYEWPEVAESLLNDCDICRDCDITERPQ